MIETHDNAALPRVRVIAFPKSGISYNDCFYRCVEEQGVIVVAGLLTGGWLWDNLRRGDWVHLHWPSFDYNKGGGVRLLLAFMRWVVLMILVRLLGGYIIWTAHNLLPHDRAAIPSLDILARRLVIAFSTKIMVHGKLAAECVVARFPTATSKICLIPHGNWIDYYTCSMNRDTARAHLGLPLDRYVYLFIGLCKPYKNLDGLVKAFCAMPGNAILLIAGKFPNKDYYDQVSALAKGDPRIRIQAGFVPDEMMQVYLPACDAVVVPYREILTSGTAMLALSFGRPVVSVDLGFLKDVINEKVGLLFSSNTSDGMLEALVAVRSRNFKEREILAHARTFSFEDAAKLFLAALRQ